METKVETVWAKSVLHGEAKWIAADEAYDRGQQAYLDWCKELAVLYKEGTATQEEIATRYEKTQQRISDAIQVGSDPRFKRITFKLPKSNYAVYLLTTLPDDAFEELAKPDTTQAKILEYKRRLKGIVLPPTDGDGFVEAMTAAPEFAERPKCPGPEYKYDPIAREWYIPTPEPVKPVRPPCPGVEGLQPGQWQWFDNSWTPILDFKGTTDQKTYTSFSTSAGDKHEARNTLIAAFTKLVITDTPEARKLIKRFLSTVYHPDSGIIQDDVRMSAINQALQTLEK